MKFDDALESIIENTFQAAISKQHEYVSLEHLLPNLLNDQQIVALLEYFAIDRNVIIAKLDQLIKKIPMTDSNIEPIPTGEFSKVFECTAKHSLDKGKAEVTPLDVFFNICCETRSVAWDYLNSEGVNKIDMLRYIEHGMPVLRKKGDSDQAGIILFHDNYTPVDFVEEILVTVFQIADDQITSMINEAKNKRRVFLGYYDYQSAIDMIRLVNKLVAEAGYPLLVTLVDLKTDIKTRSSTTDLAATPIESMASV